MIEDVQPESLPEQTARARRRAGAQEVRDRRRRLAVGALWFVLGALLVNAMVGEDGYLATVRARGEEAELQQQVAALRLENRRLQQEARRLQDDQNPTAIEEAARDMNFVYPGETLVIIHEATPARSPAPGR